MSAERVKWDLETERNSGRVNIPRLSLKLSWDLVVEEKILFDSVLFDFVRPSFKTRKIKAV